MDGQTWDDAKHILFEGQTKRENGEMEQQSSIEKKVFLNNKKMNKISFRELRRKKDFLPFAPLFYFTWKFVQYIS